MTKPKITLKGLFNDFTYLNEEGVRVFEEDLDNATLRACLSLMWEVGTTSLSLKKDENDIPYPHLAIDDFIEMRKKVGLKPLEILDDLYDVYYDDERFSYAFCYDTNPKNNDIKNLLIEEIYRFKDDKYFIKNDEGKLVLADDVPALILKRFNSYIVTMKKIHQDFDLDNIDTTYIDLQQFRKMRRRAGMSTKSIEEDIERAYYPDEYDPEAQMGLTFTNVSDEPQFFLEKEEENCFEKWAGEQNAAWANKPLGIFPKDDCPIEALRAYNDFKTTIIHQGSKELYQMPNLSIPDFIDMRKRIGYSDQKIAQELLELYDLIDLQAYEIKTVGTKPKY